MKKILLIIMALAFYPFGCEAQINGNIKPDGGYIFSVAQVDSLNTVIWGQIENIKKLEIDLQVALNNVVHDTVYQDKIIEVIPGIKKDTIITVSDPILLDWTDSLIQPADAADVYVMVMGIGLVHLQDLDTIYRFQRHYKIERTVDYSETKNQPTTYRNIGLPFQAREWYIVPGSTTSTSVRVRVLATDQCQIQFNLNGTAPAHAAGSEYFNASKLSDIEYRHTRLIDNLTPDTAYIIQITIVNQAGHIDVVDLNFKTSL